MEKVKIFKCIRLGICNVLSAAVIPSMYKSGCPNPTKLVLQSRKRLLGWLVLSDELVLQKKSKNSFSNLSQIGIQLSTDTIFIVV